eukprot:2962955-Rhodomonas_salina.2
MGFVRTLHRRYDTAVPFVSSVPDMAYHARRQIALSGTSAPGIVQDGIKIEGLGSSVEGSGFRVQGLDRTGVSQPAWASSYNEISLVSAGSALTALMITWYRHTR